MSEIEQEREKKYNLLKSEILDQGYDPLAFQIYCEQLKKDGSDDIDAWDYNELKETIQRFKVKEDDKEKRLTQVGVISQQESKEEMFQEEEKKDQEQTQAQRSQSTPTSQPSEFQVSKNIDDINFKIEIECKVPQRTPLTDYILENSNKQVEIVMNEFMTKSEGIFSTGYGAFKVQTQPIGWSVWRRFSDFAWLRTILTKAFPCHLVPPIPKKKIKVKATQQSYLEKRMKVMELFLHNCLHHPIIKTHPAFSDFLSISDDAKFKQSSYDRLVGPTKPSDFISTTGSCQLEISPQIKNYSQTLNDYLKNSGEIYTKIGVNFKKMFLDLDTLSSTLQNISGNFTSLSKVTDLFCKTNQQQTKGGLQYIQMVYSELSKFFEGWYHSIIFQMKNIKENFYEFFRFHRKMQDQALDFVNQRNTMQQKFTEMKNKLQEKKEKLFAQNDTSKWELPPDIPLTIKELQVNKGEAFKYMLLNETKQLNDYKDTFAFMNHQLTDEIHEMMDFRMVTYCKKFIRVAQMRALETAKLHHVLADFLQTMAEIQGQSTGSLSRRTASVYVDPTMDSWFGMKPKLSK